MKNTRQFFTFLIAMLMCFTLVSQTVLADSTGNVSCDSSGKVTNSEFFNPKLVYKDYKAGPDGCGEVDNKKFFSGIACNFLVTMNNVFSRFYCAVQFGMNEIMMAVITLYVIVFGYKLLIGTQEANLGATILAMIKVGILVGFIKGGLLGVGFLYDFFAGVIMDTVSWVVKSITCNMVNPVDFATCLVKTDFTSVFSYIDSKIYSSLMGIDDGTGTGHLVDGLFSEEAKVILLFVVLFAICPPLYILAWNVMKESFMFLISTFTSILLCLVVVSFLIALSPIFLCFMLFGSTYNIFDSWLKYLISYAIQPSLIFAIFAIWLLIIVDFTGFVGQLQKVMIIGSNAVEQGPTAGRTIGGILFCQPRYITSQTAITMPSPPATILPQVTLGAMDITCCRMIDDPNGGSLRICDPDKTHNIEKAENIPMQGDLISPDVMIKDNGFISFLAYHLISMIVISYVFLHMLKQVPQIAMELSGASSALPLGAGFRGPGGGLGGLVKGLSGAITSGKEEKKEEQRWEEANKRRRGK